MNDVATELLARCHELAQITAVPGRVDRFHLTPEHTQANELVARWMADAGLRTWVDPAGNICGRKDGRAPGLPAVLLGSHLDTVPDAGKYDGPLGVVLAIEVARRFDGQDLPFALEVIGFSDEEGTRFGTALLGSKAVSGAWDPALLARTDREGVTLRDALQDFGLDPDRVAQAARHDLLCFLEAHIEQGPELEDAGLPLGLVTSIAGARRFLVTVHGEARHAGGTPYERRRDALLGASAMVLEVERLARTRGVIATVGRLQVFPGAVNVVPGRVELTVDLRAEHDAERDAVWDLILTAMWSAAEMRGLRLEVEEGHRAAAVRCAPRLQEAIATGIRSTGQHTVPPLFSKAGHDAMALDQVTDVGMLFVRCDDGISHHPDEAVVPADCAAAADAFEATIRALAGAG